MTEAHTSGYRWVILVLACIASFPMMAGLSSFGIVAPLLQQKLSLTADQVETAGNILTWGLWFGFGLSSFFIARLGIKKTLLCGLLLVALPQFLIPMATSFQAVLALRVIQGLCSMCIPVLFAYVAGSGWFSAREGGIATGLFLGGINCGAFFGDAVANALVSQGLDTTMFVMGAFALAVLALCAMGLRTPAAATQPAATAKAVEADAAAASRSIFAYKETWLLLLLFIPMCTPYWAVPIIWPQYAKSLGFDAGQITTINLWVSIVGFIAVIGGVVSDGMLRKTGNVVRSRLGCILVFMIIAFIGMFAAAGVDSLSPMILTMILAGACYAAIAVYWTLLGVVYPPDPELNGKAASLLTFVGNSPVVFLTPLSAWIAGKSSWSAAFVEMAVVAVIVMLPTLYALKKMIAAKQRGTLEQRAAAQPVAG
ncbi:MAG: MFS transporter [Solidesulfovibrio sp.]|uniref:MFS transporter n=2 Tax=Solidesulfovibrio sp. TaxID=2910990 RepID=UPI003158767F